MRIRIILFLLWPLCVLACVLGLVRMAWSILFSTDRGWLLSVAFDQLGNTTANGDPDETISSRAARARLDKRRWGCVLCRLLDALDTDHCKKNLEARFLSTTYQAKSQE